MTEHKICKGCKFNNYPECHGTIMDNGSYMNIENLKPMFQCGQKDELELTDFSIEVKSKVELELEDLQEQINELKGELLLGS